MMLRRLACPCTALLILIFVSVPATAQFNNGAPRQSSGQPRSVTPQPQPSSASQFQGQPGFPAQNSAARGQLAPGGQVQSSRHQQPAAGPRVANLPQRPTAPQAPFPPLSAAQQDFVDKVLIAWQQKSDTVQRYRCKFNRFEYDPVFGPPADPKTGQPVAKTIEVGEIKYETPDKGLFRVETTWRYKTPTEPGDQKFEKSETMGEYWVCDGHSIFEFDSRQKLLIQREMPPQLQGKSIAEDGPLPFLFGAKADKIKERYWVRSITPENSKSTEIWLEAFPKRQTDAGNFQRVHIVIDRSQFLPKAIRVFPPQYDPRRNPVMTTYAFEAADINWAVIPKQLDIFRRSFYAPKAPSGWKLKKEPYNPVAVNDAARQQAPNAPRTVQPHALPPRTNNTNGQQPSPAGRPNAQNRDQFPSSRQP